MKVRIRRVLMLWFYSLSYFLLLRLFLLINLLWFYSLTGFTGSGVLCSGVILLTAPHLFLLHLLIPVHSSIRHLINPAVSPLTTYTHRTGNTVFSRKVGDLPYIWTFYGIFYGEFMGNL